MLIHVFINLWMLFNKFLLHSRNLNLEPYWSNELSILKRKKACSYKNWVSAGRPRAPDNDL